MYEICMFINSHNCHFLTLYDYQFSFYGRVPGYFKRPLFIFSLSMSNWPYISYVDIFWGYSIPFWTLNGMVDILKNRGWNLMGIAHYAIRLVLYIRIWMFDSSFGDCSLDWPELSKGIKSSSLETPRCAHFCHRSTGCCHGNHRI